MCNMSKLHKNVFWKISFFFETSFQSAEKLFFLSSNLFIFIFLTVSRGDPPLAMGSSESRPRSSITFRVCLFPNLNCNTSQWKVIYSRTQYLSNVLENTFLIMVLNGEIKNFFMRWLSRDRLTCLPEYWRGCRRRCCRSGSSSGTCTASRLAQALK